MPYRDSVDKIVTTYISSICRKPFEYKGKTYQPRDLRVSPLIFRGYTCPVKCGGCCPRFTLDYLPTDNKPEGTQERSISVNGKEFSIFSDVQEDNNGHFCKNLNHQDGRCGIYLNRPFSCDFELVRFLVSKNGGRVHLTQKLFGRGWAMKRVDGGTGARCTMTPPDPASKEELFRKIGRLKQWTEYLEIEHCLNEVLDYVDTGPHKIPLFINKENKILQYFY